MHRASAIDTRGSHGRRRSHKCVLRACVADEVHEAACRRIRRLERGDIVVRKQAARRLGGSRCRANWPERALAEWPTDGDARPTRQRPRRLSVLEASAVGQLMTRSAAGSGSASRISSAAVVRSAPASPMMSTGLAFDHVDGKMLDNATRVGSDSVASCPPKSARRSAASTPAPPPFVRIISRSLARRGTCDRISAASNSSGKS